MFGKNHNIMAINYTVIIPHHNIPNLLRRCLKSIPQRTDVQVVVVDDCSDEQYKEDLRNVEIENPLITFVKCKQCGGGGKARNIGIEHAVGKYLIFADADDFFNPCFEHVLDDYKNKEFDIAFFKGSSCDTDTYKLTHRADHLNRYIDLYLSGKDAQGKKLRYLFGEPWCKIIKKRIVDENNIKYDETLIHNDTTFGYLIGYYASSILVDNRELYCVTTRNGSVSKQASDDRVLIRTRVYAKAERFFCDHAIKVKLNRHYDQLVQLLYHRKIRLFKNCVDILKDNNFSTLYIIRRMLSSFLMIICRRLFRTDLGIQ
jgi:glycosyltransferase involved in cell wall biosynthesis